MNSLAKSVSIDDGVVHTFVCMYPVDDLSPAILTNLQLVLIDEAYSPVNIPKHPKQIATEFMLIVL